MNQKESLQALIKGLETIKLKGGSPFDYIEDDNGLIDENYDIALTALGFDGTHAENQFDDALKALFDSIEVAKKPFKRTIKTVVEMKGYSAPRDMAKGNFDSIINYSIGYPTWNDLQNKTNPNIDTTERIRLTQDNGDDTITDCPAKYVLRYWYKTKWIYIANK